MKWIASLTNTQLITIILFSRRDKLLSYFQKLKDKLEEAMKELKKFNVIELSGPGFIT